MTTNLDIRLEKYTLEEELSQNEWFSLYRGNRKSDGADVIVRVAAPILATDEFFKRRFKHIAQQAAQLEHPNIVQSYEAEEEDDLLYVARDFIEGRPLADVIKTEGPFSLKRTQYIAGQIAAALDYAHQKSVLHGDLSVHQIYLDDNDRIFITNFGHSQAIFGNNVAQQSYAVSSPETVAPERVRGEGPSRPADAYSLGIICYQMLTKQSPFSGPASTVFHAHSYRQPRPLHQINTGVPISVSEVVDRMLSKSVDVRYNTGAEFARALAAAAQNPNTSRQYESLIPIEEREQSQPMSFKTVFYAFCVTMVIVIVAAVAGWTGYELGLRQVAPTQSVAPVIVDSTLPTATPTAELLPSDSPQTASADKVALVTATLDEPADTLLNDFLIPTRATISVTLRSTATLTPTVAPLPTRPVPTLTPTLTPTPAVIIPAGVGMFKFYNPTGNELVVDIIGPTGASAVVDPDVVEEFLLNPGFYVYKTHTPGGRQLEPTEGKFDLGEGQVVERDYYSDYDWQQ